MITVPAVFGREIMLSVIIPTEGAEHPTVATLAALVPGAAAAVGGSHSLPCEGIRAAARAPAARQARSPWLMFLHAGAVLDHGWIDETMQFIQRVSDGGRPRAGVVRYARLPSSDFT